jgi:hypothetical protein
VCNITLVCTIHEETGNCNVTELYKIIRSIRPQVIFEELSYNNFLKFYTHNFRSLETDAVKRYARAHTVKQIPVDTFELPLAYHEKLEQMYKWMITDRTMNESFNWRCVMAALMKLESSLGFNMLNSELNDELLERLDRLEGKMLRRRNDDTFCGTRLMKLRTTLSREDKMISNIYRYSKKYPYGHALLLMGSGHRRSVIKKIGYAERQEQTKLKWEIYNS